MTVDEAVPASSRRARASRSPAVFSCFQHRDPPEESDFLNIAGEAGLGPSPSDPPSPAPRMIAFNYFRKHNYPAYCPHVHLISQHYYLSEGPSAPNGPTQRAPAAGGRAWQRGLCRRTQSRPMEALRYFARSPISVLPDPSAFEEFKRPPVHRFAGDQALEQVGTVPTAVQGGREASVCD